MGQKIGHHLWMAPNGVDTVHVMLEELHENYYFQWFLDGGRIIDQHSS